MPIVGTEEVRQVLLAAAARLKRVPLEEVSEDDPLDCDALRLLVTAAVTELRASAAFNVEPRGIHTLGEASRQIEFSRYY